MTRYLFLHWKYKQNYSHNKHFNFHDETYKDKFTQVSNGRYGHEYDSYNKIKISDADQSECEISQYKCLKHMPKQSLSTEKYWKNYEDSKICAIPDLISCNQYKILIFGGIDPNKVRYNDTDDLYGKSVFAYNFSKNNWKLISNMPGSRYNHSCVVCSKKIFIIGGTRSRFDNSKALISKSVWSFDYEKLEWCPETNLPSERRDFGLIATSSGLYVIGGANNVKYPMASMIYYDINTREWFKKPSLKLARSGLACTLIGEHIWAAGGCIAADNKITVTDIVESFDLKIEQWTNICTLRKPRCFARMATVNNIHLFIFGGLTKINDKLFDSISSVDKFSFFKKKWEKVTDMPESRHGHSIVCINDKVFIFGGILTKTTVKTTLDSVECFSCNENRWIKGINKLPIPISGFDVVYIPDKTKN